MKIENRVYICDVRALGEGDKFSDWYEKMPEYRREKIDKMKPEGGKRLSLGAGILFCEGLKSYGLDPQDVKIELGENETPFISDTGLSFNLSHSKDVAVGAFSEKEVGIDVEKVKEFKKTLVEYVFDESEINAVKEEAGSDLDLENSLYTKLWTMKESLMKYCGKGISMSPKKIVISENSVSYEGKKLENITFTHFEYGDYHISVCSEDKNFCSSMEEIEI